VLRDERHRRAPELQQAKLISQAQQVRRLGSSRAAWQLHQLVHQACLAQLNQPAAAQLAHAL
jgi:hypothetical protein